MASAEQDPIIFVRRAYRARAVRQLIAWVAGSPRHNEVDDEHTPDMACCHPVLFETDYDHRLEVMRRLVRLMGEHR